MCFLWEQQIFTKLQLIILCTASLEFSFSVKPTANNAETAACFNVPFNFLISICRIFFYPLKLTKTCLFVLCLCISLHTELCCAAEIPRCYRAASSTKNSTSCTRFFECGTCINFLCICNVNKILSQLERHTSKKLRYLLVGCQV